MFEEVVRRAMVLHDLLKRQNSDAKAKPPIIEPSLDCNTCQYYSRCYIKKKEGKPITFRNLFGSKDQKNNVGCFLIFFYEASGASGCPLPRSANVTTAIAIKTPIADPNAAIDASAIC